MNVVHKPSCTIQISLNVKGVIYNSKANSPMKGISDLIKLVMLVPRTFVL